MIDNLIQDSIGIILKKINFDNVDPEKESKIDFTDSFIIVSKQKDVVEFEISRTVIANLQTSFNLNVSAGLQVYAKEGVDLTTQLTDALISENIKDISKTVMSFLSSLISQITGSFNGIPIVTPPILQDNKQ